MRIAGILLMAAAAVAAGFFAAERARNRLEILQIFRQMVYHLKSQIMYSNATLPEALCEVGTRFADDRTGIWKEPGTFLARVGTALTEKRNLIFSEVWNTEVGRIAADVPLGKADRQNLLSLGDNLGYADRSMQERTLLFYLEQTDESIGGLKQEIESLGKLYRTLGVAAGMFLVIILI